MSRQYTLVQIPSREDIEKRSAAGYPYSPESIRAAMYEHAKLSKEGVGATVWAMPKGGQFTSRKQFVITEITATTVRGTYQKT